MDLETASISHAGCCLTVVDKGPDWFAVEVPARPLHAMKIGTIADLIAYRRRTERQVEPGAGPFDSIHEAFHANIFRNTIDRTEHVALVKGKIDPAKPTMVRMHRVDFAADLLGQSGGRRDYVAKRR